MSVYDELNLVPVINAAGTFTELGGSLMPPEVIQAWQSAAHAHVDLRQLLSRVGQRIADCLQVPAALVTGGAASSIVLGTAAAVTRRDEQFVSRQTTLGVSPAWEVLRLNSQRDAYDRQVEMCGVRIVNIHSVEDAIARSNDRTIMMLACNYLEPESSIGHQSWIRLAQRLNVPTLLDAAADTPPVERLRQYTEMGYDMVAFSGGKAIRGPQDTGLLLGKLEWIQLARQNAAPTEETIGRAMKVSKEDAVAIWKAVELFTKTGDSLARRCERDLDTIVAQLDTIPTLTTERITPPIANHFPHLVLHWDERQLGISHQQLKDKLWAGRPRIATARVYGAGTEGFLISAVTLAGGEPEIVGRRIRESFAE